MKNKTKLIVSLLLLLFVELNAQTPYFYYYNGERQYFELDTRNVFISIANESLENKMFSMHNAKFAPLRIDIPAGELPRTKQNRRYWTILSFEEKLSDSAYLARLSEIKKTEKDVIVAPFLKDKYQNNIGLSNAFYVKLKELGDTILLRQKAKEEATVIMWQNEFMPLWFTLNVTVESKYNSMEMANIFYESGLFQCAEPDLLTDNDANCVSDPYFGQQWGLKNNIQSNRITVDIKSCDAWQLSTGNNVIVAVLDHGINLSHPDLAGNIYPLSYDCEDRTSPQQLRGYHGTPCAGIIGAIRNNGIGVAGVAPNCEVMSISNSLDGWVYSRESRANGLNWAMENGADIINNSWSWTPSTPMQIVTDAIDNVVSNGRGRNGVNLGCVVVFSTGNDRRRSINFPSNSANVIAVGAITNTGRRVGESNYGTGLDVVAPGGYDDIFTTEQGGWYSNFGLTSAAAPHVSGIAALILSTNSNLTQKQVRYIIESTAQKTGNFYNYKDTLGCPNGTWNNEVGHGLVNAYEAVKMASCTTTTLTGTQPEPPSPYKQVICKEITIQNATVPANTKLELNAIGGNVNINANFEVEAGAEFEINITP